MKKTGVLIPVQAMLLLSEGKIDARDVLLLSLVNYLTSGETGCWASNAWFAKRLNVCRSTVSSIISRLLKQKILVKRKSKGKRRMFFTSWHSMKELPTQQVSDSLRVSTLHSMNTSRRSKRPPTASTTFLFKEFSNTEKAERHARTPNLRLSDVQRTNKLITIRKAQFPGRRIRSTIDNWAHQMRLLRLKVQDDPHLDMVLDWYCKNYNDKWTPKISSARGFSQKFDRIDAAMQRVEGVRKIIKVTKRADAIARGLKQTHTWPKGSATDLAELVQQAMDEFQKFFDCLKRIRDDEKVDCVRRVRIIARDLLRAFQLDPDEYAERWFEDVSKAIGSWSNWSGQMRMFEFAYSHKTFVVQCQERLREDGYDNAAEAWKIIKGVVDENC